MEIFNQMLHGGFGDLTMEAKSPESLGYKQRTFKESIGDQIAHHERKVAELKAVYESLTPDIEKFVEAMQKLG